VGYDNMKIENGYYIWNRGEKFSPSPFFQLREFECLCLRKDCLEQRISVELLSRLTKLRRAYGAPVVVTSAYRCKRHQTELRDKGLQTAKGISTHELGDAADIQPFTAYSALLMGSLLMEAEKLFKAVGVAKSFLHVDLRDDKERRWRYI
jgi:zinc D-Ala-D-Ala carboxypeptidase